MKIRAGFVSNSSSTSFLIISRNDLNKPDFLELMGVKPESPKANVFSDFFLSVTQNIDTTVDFALPRGTATPIAGLKTRGRDLPDHMVAKIKEAKKNHSQPSRRCRRLPKFMPTA